MTDPQTLFAGLAILVSIASLGVALWTYARSRVTGLQPVLILTYDSLTAWQLRNVGNGAALDVLAAERAQDGDWSRPMRIPPLAPNSQVNISPLGLPNVFELACCYCDIEGRVYTSKCKRDLSTIEKGRQLPTWPEEQIERLWVQPKAS